MGVDCVVPAIGTLRAVNFEDRARFARVMADLYDRVLRSWGLRPSFMDDILQDFQGYQTRFANDVAAMVELTSQHGPVPAYAMVLEQFPKLETTRHKILLAAQEHLSNGGFRVIDAEPYLTAYDGSKLGVSPWEGHPNEIANAIFASMIIRELDNSSALDGYQRK